MNFKSFPKELVQFYIDIAKNNNKEWFDRNRDIYENKVLMPAKEFVEVMGAKLKEISPDIIYSPKINGSIFKIYKDARYSHGAPFKTNLGIFFWEGSERLGSSGYYFQIDPPFYLCGVGLPMFSKEILNKYRRVILNPKKFKEIEAIINEMKSFGFALEGKRRKSLPRGISATGLQEELLLFDGLYISDETPINNDFYSDDFCDNLFEIFRKMRPYHNWLVKLLTSR